MSYIRRIVVVCGYGCNLDSPLKPYLDRVLAWCKVHRLDAIILCGGATQQKTFPGMTEAKVMYQYLKPLEDLFCRRQEFEAMYPVIEPVFYPQWYVLDNSYTTYENIRDAAGAIEGVKKSLGPADYEMTIFCEATRALKVAILARHFLGFPPGCKPPEPIIRIETDSWELDDPLKELESIRRTVLAIRYPWLDYVQRCEVIAKSMLR